MNDIKTKQVINETYPSGIWYCYSTFRRFGDISFRAISLEEVQFKMQDFLTKNHICCCRFLKPEYFNTTQERIKRLQKIKLDHL